MDEALVMFVVAARPNFMKAAPVLAAMRARQGEDDDVRFSPFVVHTGQHYDAGLSDVFFEQLSLPRPDRDLGVGSGSHAVQTAEVMRALEPVVLEQRPDLVLVFGDVNSTLAAALVAAKLGVPLGHVEAGLRSGDRAMPEEVNRLLTDQLADLLFVTERSGLANLAREGVDPGRVHFVGNTMIDALLAHRERFAQAAPLGELGLTPGEYACVTFHRPSNVDGEASLTRLCGLLRELAARLPVVFPVHPRTRARIEALGLGASLAGAAGLTLTEPLDYLSFMGLVAQARLVMTDSGGIQEETSVLGVPCLTLRETTERPVTVAEGTNRLVPPGDPAAALAAVDDVLARPHPAPAAIELWDGCAAGRIVDVLVRYLGARPTEAGDT